MSFSRIKKQDLAVELIRRTLRRGKVPHAWLFTGPVGTGKEEAALEFAKALNCETRAPGEVEPCDHCESCGLIDAGRHPDVRRLEPEGKGGRIRIEAVRALQRELAFKPYQGKKKVWIIAGAETMTEDAANCLLKTLEEPPADSHLVLVCARPEQLLPTVLSRCRQVTFAALDPEELKSVLMAELGLEEQFAHFLARLGEGGRERALALRNGRFCSSLEEKNLLIDSLVRPGRARERALELLAGIPREETTGALDLAASWFRDLLVLKAGASGLINLDRAVDLGREAERFTFSRLVKIIETIGVTRAHIQAYVNPKLALSVMVEQF